MYRTFIFLVVTYLTELKKLMKGTSDILNEFLFGRLYFLQFWK